MSSYISRLIQVGNGILYYVLNSTLHTDVNTTAFVYLSYLLTVNSVCCCLTVSNWILICDLFCFCFSFILHRFWSWQETHRKILKWNVSRLVTCNWPFAETRNWTAWSKQPLPGAASFRIYTSRLSARKRILCRIPSERAMSFFRRLINYISFYIFWPFRNTNFTSTFNEENIQQQQNGYKQITTDPNQKTTDAL